MTQPNSLPLPPTTYNTPNKPPNNVPTSPNVSTTTDKPTQPFLLTPKTTLPLPMKKIQL